MLSICIPVFNVSVAELTRALVGQAAKLECKSEILLFDDGSELEWREANRGLAQLPGVVYYEPDGNIGRAAIRNLLARRAQFEHLLFLDADSALVSDRFLEHYLEHACQHKVVCGGTLYAAEPPADPSQWLRYRYGKAHEQLTAEERHKRGFAITANNFLIRRELLLEVPFREQIRQYGHEDTVLGYDLYRQGINIHHIENPVEHTGLETSAIYLQKTERAIENLWWLAKTVLPEKAFIDHSSLLKARVMADGLWLTPLLGALFALTAPTLRSQLNGPNPKIALFQLYKLGYLFRLPAQQEGE